jgi:hypothetical protein
VDYIKYQWARLRKWWVLFHLEGSIRYKIRVLERMLVLLESEGKKPMPLCGLCSIAIHALDFKTVVYNHRVVIIKSREIIEVLGLTHFEPPDHIKYDLKFGTWWFSQDNRAIRRIILWEMLRYYRELNFSAEIYGQYKTVVPVEPLPADPMGWLMLHNPSFKHWCIYHF